MKKDIEKLLKENKAVLKKEFNVKTIGVFGSFTRGEETTESDLDILVEFTRPIGLFEFIKLKRFLSDLLKVNVDLVMKKALKPRIGKRILKEAVYV